MGIWKKIGIVAGAVAATAVAGPFGAVGVLGAAAAAGATGLATGAITGGIAGSILDKIEEEKRRKQRQIGREEGAAEAAKRIEKMEELIKQMVSSMQQANEHYQFIIALTAVGMAAAKIVGNDLPEEKDNIIEYISGISNVSLPDKVKQKVNTYKNNPPSLQDALVEVRKLPNNTPNQFKNVILLALNENETGAQGSAGQKFLQAWDQEFV